MLAFGLAGFRAGGRNCFVSDLGVPVGRDFLLCNENCITDRAVLAFGLAGSRAGRLDCRVNDLGVTLGRDLLLCNENRITDRAVLALGLAGLRAGGRNCFVSDLGVTLGRDLRLCNDNLITDRAVLALGLAGFRAGRLDCFVNDLGVCSLLNRFARPAYLGLTNRAIHDLIVAAFFCASGSDFIFPDCFPASVSVGRDRLRLGLFTDAAGEGLFAGSGAGCRGGDNAGVPGVSTILPAGLEGQVGKGEKLWSVPLSIFKLVWFIPCRFTHRSGDQPAIEKLSLRGSKAADRQRVGCAGASVWNLHRVHRPRAATCVKGNGQLFKLIELRRKIYILMRIKAPAINAVINIRFPSVFKVIGVILVLGPCGVSVGPIPRGFFFTGVIPLLQDRAVPVEPTDMIFVQRPLRIEGAIPAKRDRRLIRIGRPGTVCRCVPAGKIIVRTGKGIGNQGCRRVWLHGLGTHAAIAAVGAEGNNRLLCPLRIKCSVFREGSGCPIIIGRAGAICRRIPAGKGVVFISKAVTRQGNILSRRAALGGHRSRAAVGIEGNGDRRRFAAPSVVFVFDLGALRIVPRLLIAAVPIAQLGRGDGDLDIIWRPVVLNTLIGFAAFAKLALLNIYAGALAGADICAALRGVDGSRRRQRAVDIDGGV